MEQEAPLEPLLVVRGAGAAVDHYARVLSATVRARYEHGPERRVSHAELSLGRATLAVTEEAPAFHSFAPPSLGGSPVVLQLRVDDVDAALEAMRGAGATVLFPAQRFLGERMARARDPFGHVWLLRQTIEALSVDEIQRRRDELFARRPAGDAPVRQGEDPTTLRDATPRAQRSDDAPRLSSPRPRGRVHLVLGPVGAGKSTFSRTLCRDRGAQAFALDAWMARLFRADRPNEGVVAWYVERAARCVEQIWSVARPLAEAGVDVVLEIGLLRRSEREAFYAEVDAAALDLTVHVLDAPRDVRRERVARRNHERGETFSMVVPPEVFELASDAWEPLGPDELAGRE